MIKVSIQKQWPDVTIDVKGEIVEGIHGIFGPSGCGKTSVLNLLAGFVQPDEQDNSISEKDVGIVFQDQQLFPHMTVEDNIRYGLKENALEIYKEAVNLFDLSGLLRRKPQFLSGGEKQRVAIVRTVLSQPKILCLDEALSSLDWKMRYQMMMVLKQWHQKYQTAIIIVSHSLTEMLFMTDSIWVMEQGKVIESGITKEVLFRTKCLDRESWGQVTNVFELSVYSSDADQMLLDWQGQDLIVNSPANRNLKRAWIGFHAADIIISLHPVEGLSSRNRLSGVIDKIYQIGQTVLLHCAVGEHMCYVQITRKACEDMKLKQGLNVYLIVKANQIKVWS